MLSSEKSIDFLQSIISEYNISYFDTNDPLKMKNENMSYDELNRRKFAVNNIVASKLNGNFTNEMKNSLGMSIDEMSVQCFTIGRECKDNDFQWTYHFSYGNCYRFNTGETWNDKNKMIIRNISVPIIRVKDNEPVKVPLFIKLYVGMPEALNKLYFEGKGV